MNCGLTRQVAAAFVLVALLGCAKGQAAAQRTSSGAIILPTSAVDDMLRQCSRDAPVKGEGTWMPSATDIDLFEGQLTAALPQQLVAHTGEADEPFPSFPSGFTRQYVGIIRDGRRLIYGSFAPKDLNIPIDPMKGPLRICDGGPQFFGAEFDVEAKRFTHWAFNGQA